MRTELRQERRFEDSATHDNLSTKLNFLKGYTLVSQMSNWNKERFTRQSFSHWGKSGFLFCFLFQGEVCDSASFFASQTEARSLMSPHESVDSMNAASPRPIWISHNDPTMMPVWLHCIWLGTYNRIVAIWLGTLMFRNQSHLEETSLLIRRSQAAKMNDCSFHFESQ